jgi:hypothetical protein
MARLRYGERDELPDEYRFLETMQVELEDV